MPMGPGADRWCRLLLIALFALLLPAVIGTAVDDGGMAVYDPAESDDDRIRLAAGTLSGPAWIPPAPRSVRRRSGPAARDPVVAGWTCRTPTDRAPPRV